MLNYLKLTKVLMKSGLMLSDAIGKKKKGFYRFLLFIIAIGLLPITIMVAFATWQIAHRLVDINQQGVALSIVLNLTSIFSLVFGINVILNVFYFANDIEHLLPLPLKPYQIVGAKFTIALLNESVMQILLVVGAFIGYAIAVNDSNVTYWLFSMIGVLTVPIIPLIYCAILSMVIMRFTNFIANKDLINKISGIFVLAITLVITASLGLIRNVDIDVVTEMLIEGNNSFVRLLHTLFPHIQFLVTAIADLDYGNLIFYLLVNIIFIVIFLMISEKIYYKGVIGLSATNTKRKIIHPKEYIKIFSESPSWWTYFLKELKVLFRTPVFFINCVLINFIWPVFIYVIFSMYGKTTDLERLIGRLAFLTDRSKLIILILVIAMTVFVCSANCICSTTISREGKGWYFIKCIPIKYMTQLNIKAITGISIGLIGTFIYIIFTSIRFKAPLGFTICSLIVCLLVNTLIGYTGLLIDIFNPKLNWDDEQNALRQNFNTFLFMILTSAASAFFCIYLFILLRVYSLSFSSLVSITIALLILFNIIAYYCCHKYGVKRLMELGND